ncbi:TadE/TadG family type IV pilus assembly protein [Tersicoccus sp. Bi-70]|uniref:TadE/TadG family type IV pilus assembly protein n=1 Tax=Tersicoccus sp. Bi-70 TaxID=1897634 RepID=UPI0009778897|nr:TadE family protein [Tersicoccus sp. Bi-70]OMH35198.1 pilus assembly protein TadE [Tersicoccus sp. Bi-70]
MRLPALAGEDTGGSGLRDGERGSAVVDFVLVGAVLTLLAMSIVQLAVIVHVRNTLLDAASSGARYGSLADRTATEGQERARDLVLSSLGPDYAGSVQADESRDGGRRTLRVVITAPMPVLGLIGPSGLLEVQGHASAGP